MLLITDCVWGVALAWQKCQKCLIFSTEDIRYMLRILQMCIVPSLVPVCVSVCVYKCVCVRVRVCVCRNVEEMLKARGEDVKRFVNSEDDGTLEVTLWHCYTQGACHCDSSFLMPKVSRSPPTGSSNRGGIGYGRRFLTNISLYLRNGARWQWRRQDLVSGGAQKLLGVFMRQLSTYSCCQTLYRSKYTGKKLTVVSQRGARAPVPHSWRRQCKMGT